MTRRSGSTNQCFWCGQYFGGPKPYGMHFASSGECLSVDALRAAGLQLSDAGFWIVPRSIALSTQPTEVSL